MVIDNVERLKGWRKGSGLTRKAAAGVLGVSYEAIVSWEIGRRRVKGAVVALLDILIDNPEIMKRKIAALEKAPR